MDVDTFLAQLSAERRSEQARCRQAISLSGGFTLDRDLEVAVRNHWFISPAFAQAIFPPRAACVGIPDNDPEQISYWTELYVETCNWAVFPSLQCPVLEINLPVAAHSLEWLAEHDGWDWQRTLRFRAGNLWFAMLRMSSEETRPRAARMPGLRLLCHNNAGLLIPPSRTRDDSRLEYADPLALPREAPASLFVSGDDADAHGRDMLLLR